MSRRARLVVAHILHHVTQRGNRGENVFFDAEDRLYFLDRQQFYSRNAGLKLALHCLMDNHTHLLAVPEDKKSMERTFKSLHMCYSQFLNRKFRRTGVNWQGKYFSAPLDDRHAWNAFQYIAMNPVRAGLSSSFVSYRWSSAHALAHREKNALLTADTQFLTRGRDALTEVNAHEVEPPDAALWNKTSLATLRNFPSGSREFVEKLETKFGRVLRPKVISRPRGKFLVSR